MSSSNLSATSLQVLGGCCRGSQSPPEPSLIQAGQAPCHLGGSLIPTGHQHLDCPETWTPIFLWSSQAPSNSLFPQSAPAMLPLVQSRSHQTLRAHHTLPFFLTSSRTPPTWPLPALFSQSVARANRQAHLGSFGHPHHGHYRRSEPQSFFQTAIQQREIFELKIWSKWCIKIYIPTCTKRYFTPFKNK